MYNYKKITDDMYLIGGNDRRISLFESAYPVPDGISYNSYFVDGEQTLVLDTVDSAVGSLYFENIDELLSGRCLDFLIINHMEPDHSSMLKQLVERYANVKIICNSKAKTMIAQFCDFCDDDRFVLVNEGESLKIGSHTYTFFMAPMVHWPEVMVTYDNTDKILYSADAFGTFGALSGDVYADEVNFEQKHIDEARRYYTNIVGKYGVQVTALLKKAATLDIQLICPLHGPIFRNNFEFIIDKYAKWSSYTPEDKEVLIAYASIYGNTANAAQILANELSLKGIKTVMYDVSVTHYSVVVAEAFRCSHIVLAAPTYNSGVFSSMEALLCELKAHNLQNRTVAFIENGSWGPMAAKIMKEAVASMKNMNVIENIVTVKSSLKPQQRKQLTDLAKSIKETF